ncbi:MAG: autotransporter domain-containing protein, partial [Sphingomonas sp.]
SGTGYTIDLQNGSTVTGGIDARATTGANTITIAGALTGGYLGGGGIDGVTLVDTSSVAGLLDGGAGTDGLILSGSGTGNVDNSSLANFETVTKTGTGRFNLSGADTSAATFTIQQGVLSVLGGAAINDGALVTIASAGTLDLASSESIGALTGSGFVTLGANTLSVIGDQSTNFGGVISGSGGLTKGGAGTLTLSGSNTYSGATTVSAGALALGASDVLGDATNVAVAAGTVLDLRSYSDTIGSLALGGALNGTGTLTAASYTLNGATVNANLGTGTLRQAGGTSVLNGTSAASNVYVDAGVLVLGAADRLNDASALAVASGAVLDLGAYSDTVGNATLAGTLAGMGTLTAGSYTLGGAVVSANLGGGTLLQVSGTSVLNGTANTGVVTVGGGTLRLGASNRIVDSASVTIGSGATFDLAGNNETIGTLGGTGSLSLGAGTLTVGGTNGDFGFGGTIGGAGDVTKTGTGTFTLVGNETMTGRLNVTAGTLLYAATSAGGARVQGGTLSGGGTLAGNLTLASGTLSPGMAGQPIGTFQTGSLNVTGGTLAIDFAGSSGAFRSDQVRVTGAAGLTGGTVVPVALEPSANYRLNNEYQILSAGTLSGTFGNGATFAQVAGTSDLYWRLRYDLTPNAVLLEVRKTFDLTGGLSGASGNELAVGGALGSGQLTGSDAYIAALNTIAALSPADRAATFDSLGGEALADMTSSIGLAGNRFTELLHSRLTNGSGINDGDVGAMAAMIDGRGAQGAIRQAAPVVGNASQLAGNGTRVNAWLQGYGANGSIEGRSGTARVTDYAAGAAAGLEVQAGNVTAGLAGSVSDLEANVRARLSRNTGTLYQGGGYVAYDDGATFANAIASYFGGRVSTSRSVFVGASLFGQATGRATTHGYSAGAALGHRFDMGGGLFVTPQVSGEAVQVTRNAFTETGAGVFSLAVAAEKRDLYSAIGELRLSHKGVTASGGVVEPYASLGLRVNFGDLDTLSALRFTGAPAGTGAFTIAGARLASTSALITGGINAHPSDTVSIGVEAGGAYARQQQEGKVSMHLKIGF